METPLTLRGFYVITPLPTSHIERCIDENYRHDHSYVFHVTFPFQPFRVDPLYPNGYIYILNQIIWFVNTYFLNRRESYVTVIIEPK
jgi:hypothetical protein